MQDYLARAARWEIDRTKADGFRLEAVKHVRDDFFGAEYGSDKNSSTYDYLGQISQQFKLTRGFSDTNYRDTVFNTELPRDDAMFFGEHLGGTPQQPYIDAGMRLLDNALSSTLNGDLSTGPLNGLDADGGGASPAAAGWKWATRRAPTTATRTSGSCSTRSCSHARRVDRDLHRRLPPSGNVGQF